MSYTNGLDDPTIYFNTILYTGNGSTQSITGVGFQPDMVWTKSRGNANNHNIYDAVRGATKRVYPNSTSAEVTTSNTLTAFDSDGFSLGSQDNVNASGITMASWNWLAGGTASSNTDGSITSTVSANTTSGFSIVTYTGTGSSATIGHGLGSAPSVVICKQLNATQQWINYHKAIGATKYLHLNATDASATSSTVWNDTDPTSSVFSVGTAVNCNGSGNTYVAYCFTEKKGFSKFGSYTGNGNADGTFVYTGFKPAFVIYKNADATYHWGMFDNKRNSFNVVDNLLFPNLSHAEQTGGRKIDMLSNGFKVKATDNISDINGSGNTIIYMAFAESPFVNSNGVPCNAR